jgi:hypothetical protein
VQLIRKNSPFKVHAHIMQHKQIIRFDNMRLLVDIVHIFIAACLFQYILYRGGTRHVPEKSYDIQYSTY